MAAAPPPKPWERNRGTSALTSSVGTAPGTAGVTAALSTVGEANAGVMQSTIASTTTSTNAALTRPVPARPWEQGGLASTSYSQPYGGSSYHGGGAGTYGGYGSSYTSQYGNLGGGYGLGGTYGSNYGSSFGGGYGRPMYGAYGGSSMYGSPYNSLSPGYGSQMYGGGFGGLGGVGSLGAPGNFDPNNPPAQPPSAWHHFLMAMNGALQFFGKIVFLVDENTHAFHFFINALLQLLDRAGSLYGELARFILRLLRRKRARVCKELEPGPTPTNPVVGEAVKQGYEPSSALVPHPSLGRNFATPATINTPSTAWEGLWKD